MNQPPSKEISLKENSPKENPSRDTSPSAKARGKQALRLWLRLLSCESAVEQGLRQRLRTQYAITLPQFDVLAELEHAGHSLTMSELSHELMVSNGNVTGVVDRLVRDGYVERQPSTEDRRVQYIALTASGLQRFAEIAVEHENWVAAAFSDLAGRDMEDLARLLRKTQESITRSLAR
jgi:DNA-binding MarR family transcriptional regulator